MLAKHLWTGVTRWINRKRQVPSSLHIENYARDICQYEVGVVGAEQGITFQGMRESRMNCWSPATIAHPVHCGAPAGDE